jgi:hypothetical protein
MWGKRRPGGEKSVCFKFPWCNCMVFVTIINLDYDQLKHIIAVKQVHAK